MQHLEVSGAVRPIHGSLRVKRLIAIQPRDEAASLRNLYLTTNHSCGPGSSVGTATDYGLDGPGSNPGGDEIFRPSRQALWPTQPPVK